MNEMDFFDELVMPISTSTYKPDPKHKLIAATGCRRVKLPYLKELDGRLLTAFDMGYSRFIIVADRKVTARKAAVYMSGKMRECAHDEEYCGDLFEEEDDGFSEDGFDEDDNENAMMTGLSIVEEVNLSTIRSEEMKQLKSYSVEHFADENAAVVLVTGLEDGLDLEEKLEAVKNYSGPIYLWVPKALLSDRNIYELELMEGFCELEVKEPDDAYYASVLSRLAERYSLTFSDDTKAMDIILRLKRRLSERLSEECVDRCIKRAKEGAKRSELTTTDFFPDFKAEGTAMERLFNLTGLKNVKNVIRQELALSRERVRNKKLLECDFHNNMIFSGNPGTGKSTTARLFAECLCECGASSGVFLSVSRQDLVGKFVGHSAPKVAEAFSKARGGVLFVDEAGFLLNRSSGGYVDEVLKEFVRFMELEPRVTVIFAMYEKEAEEFLSLDMGLRSRISRVVRFDDYDKKEIAAIAKGMFKIRGYRLSENVPELLTDAVERLRGREDFGNARDVRRIVDAAICSHSVRIHLENGGDKSDPDLINADDMKRGIEAALKNPGKDSKKMAIGFAASFPLEKNKLYGSN